MLIVKQYDTRNAIEATLIKNGTPISLVDCNVFISISGLVYKEECIVHNAESGQVYFPLEHRVTAKTGFFNYEFIVEYKDGRMETFPNDGYLKLRIMSEIKE